MLSSYIEASKIAHYDHWGAPDSMSGAQNQKSSWEFIERCGELLEGRRMQNVSVKETAALARKPAVSI